jgi:hypothetical protein
MAAGVAVRTRLRVLGAGNGGGQMTTASPDSGRPRRLIASYETYYEAQRAVDALSDSGFPVETVTIVGSDLRLVERVTGRLTIWRAALAGAVTGAWFGFLIGLVFWIVSPWARRLLRGTRTGAEDASDRRPAHHRDPPGRPTDAGGLRGVPADRLAVGAPPVVPDLRPRGLL